MNRIENAVQWMDDMDMEPMLLLGDSKEVNDYSEAFVGVSMDDSKAVYDEDKVIKIFMERDGMSDMEAIEFFEFNVRGAYMGEKTPSFIKTDFDRGY